MKTRSIHPRILWLAAVVLIASWIMHPGSDALENMEGQEWLITQNAAAKQLLGDCPGRVCRELCYFNAPQGDFLCFNN